MSEASWDLSRKIEHRAQITMGEPRSGVSNNRAWRKQARLQVRLLYDWADHAKRLQARIAELEGGK